MDVGDWLRSLGLGQHEALFRENEIDAEVLPELTDGDLEKIGVPLGHRKRLLKAIANLGAAEAPAKPTIVPSTASSRDVAEHRPITVMFCDLVGSTSLAARLDPEDWRNLVGSYLDAASAAVTSLGGHVLKKLGDGLMALFGYPQAQENDGERAVRAALAIQRALADLNARNAATGAPELAARIGLESGRVVVDSSGEVYGEAPNVAARVQSAAAPGEIWITRGVHRQIAGLFVAEDKGEHELKGVTEKAQLYRIVRASGGGRRGGSRAPTPLIGRGEELDILARRWERARRGEGQLALIVGEPGLGKSRLIEEFRARLAETPHTWVEWASSQLLQNTPLHPIADWGRVRFGGAEVAGEKRLAELEAALGSVGLDAAEYAPLLAPVIDAPLAEGRVPKLSPEELRSRQLAALAAWVLAGARTQPIVLAFEDLHWADPTSLDVLQALAERGAQASLLIIATTRPEFRPPWKLRSHHGVISLAPLDAGEIVRMVGEIATRHALSKEVIAGVSERSGGVPLFVEEVTRLLLERGEHGGVQAIPPTLQQSLAARLDRLGSAREIAQIGSVLGRGFSYALLKSVAAVDDRGQTGVDDRGQTGVDDPGPGFLDAALEKLADAELLFVEGVAPHANYRFKHALIQDAAYDSLLKSRRQTLHRRAAEMLLAAPAPEAEALAHHFTQAGQTDLAIEWWGKAGDQALRRSAFAEAISHLGKAIELSDKVGAAPRREAAAAASASQRLKLQTDYGQAVMWSKGFGAEEAKAAFTRAGELATEIGAAEAPFDAYYGRFQYSLVRGDLGSALETAESFLRDAERAARPTEAAVAHRLLGMGLFCQGDFVQAQMNFEQALKIYDPEREQETKFRLGQDSRVGATAFLALAVWCLGDVARARELMDEASARAVESAHVPTLAITYTTRAMLEILRSDAEAAQRAAEACVALSREHGLALYLALGSFPSAWARAKLSDRVAGAVELRQAMAEYTGKGNRFQLPFYLGLVAEIEAEVGGAQAALAGIDGALARAGETAEHWFDAGLHRIRGEILLKQNSADPAPAEAAFLAAIAVAQQQKARSFELRAALSLAKLYRATGRPIDAHDVLRPALQGFAPTAEFPQIAEANGLFEALAETDAVKVASASHRKRLQLQVAYGNALISARGYQAPETTEAFARGRKLAAGIEDASERFSSYYGLWAGSIVRGDVASMQEIAETLLHDCENQPESPEAAVAHRINGMTNWFRGDFTKALAHLEQALTIFDPERDRELAFRFGQDIGVTTMAFLASTLWPMGEAEPAGRLAEEMTARAAASGHIATIVWAHCVRALFEVMRRNPTRAAPHAEALVDLAREHGMALWTAYGSFLHSWARWHLGDRNGGLAEVRRSIVTLREQGVVLYVPLLETALAEIEVEEGQLDAALATLNRAVADTERTNQRWFEADIRRMCGEILLKQSPAHPAPAEADFLAAIAVAQQQKARSFELRAALSLAKLYQSTGRPIEAHDVLVPALAGFSPTPEFPQIAEAKALFEALAETDAVKVAGAAHKRRVDLQIAYGNAMIHARGFDAPETAAAFAHARELAGGTGDALERVKGAYGIWVGNLVRGELAAMREAAAGMLRDVETQPGSAAASVALRINGTTFWYAGDFGQARHMLERALAISDPEPDRELAYSFGQAPAVSLATFLSLTLWPLGEIERATKFADLAIAEAGRSPHIPTIAYAQHFRAVFEMMANRPNPALERIEQSLRLAREHDLPKFWVELGSIVALIAQRRLGTQVDALAEAGERITRLRTQGYNLNIPFHETLLAEVQAERGDAHGALAALDRALAETECGGQRWFDAETNRIRGEILVKQNPADPAAAEAAFLAAIAVAQQQKARSFELRAALSLAKLYQSTGRPIDAHDVLALALAGFSPTPEFPQIAEAKALFDALESDETVKADGARRAQRLKLQTNYSYAVMWSKGFAAEETKAAFTRVGELATEIGDAEALGANYFARWVHSFWRGELGAARETVESFLREAERAARPTEAAAAHRSLGLTCLFQGDLEDARAHFEQTLRIYDPERDREARYRFGQDSDVGATAYLAHAAWRLGDVGRARELIDEADARAAESAHAPTLANTYIFKTIFEIVRDDAEAALRAAEKGVALSRTHGLEHYVAFGSLASAWGRAKLGDRDAGSTGLRQALAEYVGQGNKFLLPLFQGLLAEIDAEGGGAEAALAVIDGALAGETGEHWFDAGLHRIRGEILLKQNPADAAPAEAAFLAAIAVAQQQKARSFELRAALSLAKFYQSTGRPIDAHDILGPALEGFSPTPEFPEVGDAQALVAAVEADARL